MSDEAIRQFLQQPAAGSFDSLALELLRRQDEIKTADARDSATAALGASPSWDSIAPVRAETLPARNTPPADSETLRDAVQTQWRLLQPEAGTPILLLMETATDTETDLAFAVLQSTPANTITHPVGQGRVDRLAIRSWLGARQRQGRPVWIVASTELANTVLDELERRRLRFRLPPASKLLRVFPGQSILESDVRRSDEVTAGLGIPARDHLFLAQLPTLASHLTLSSDGGRGLTLSAPPPWVQYRIVGERDTGGSGRLAVMDLATTRLPAYQELEWRVTDEGGEIRLQSLA